VRVTALGYGVALANMLVRQEYGAQSEHSTLDTIKEVLTDATYGIIDKYVEKVMATATNSGYTINTTKVATISGTLNYLWFPCKPAIKCMEDMIELVRAAKTPNAGCHWIIVPSSTTAYLCVATVGNHENPPADVWPTWFNTDQAGSTIEVKKDMIVSSFEQKRSRANYVLFVGSWRRPASGDTWTENNSADWAVTAFAHVTDEAGAGLYKIGSKSIKGQLDVMGEEGVIYYPDTYDLNLDISNIGTKKVIPRIGFYIRCNSAITGSLGELRLGTGDPANDDYFSQELDDELVADTFVHAQFPIGQHYDLDQTSEKEWTISNNADWADIDWIGFYMLAGNHNAFWYVDGLHFSGVVTRAAYDLTKIGTQKCKMLFVHDDIPKDDTLRAAGDSGQIAQFCKAELFRAASDPIIGQIKIPMKETIKAGQLAHIHACKQSDSGTCAVCGESGTFRIAKDMRIMNVRHHFGDDGALSYLSLTDDVKSSHPLQLASDYNTIIKAVAPGFQDRVRGSIVAADIDFNQTILGKDYST